MAGLDASLAIPLFNIRQGDKSHMTENDLSFDHVAYELRYFGDDQEIYQALVATIMRLPQDVAEFVLERCSFVSVGGETWAQTMPVWALVRDLESIPENVWVITLSEKLSAEDLHSIIAHEIAHAWLKHGEWLKHGKTIYKPPDAESQAANQARDWGFTGKGADAEFCDKLTMTL
jgi:hypothetical protein